MKTCIFIDGENFRHSLVSLFEDNEKHSYSFDQKDQLPNADWFGFFQHILGYWPGCDFLRAYWYVIQEIDFRPMNLPYKKVDLIPVLERASRQFSVAIGNAEDPFIEAKKIKSRLLENKNRMIQRKEGWDKIYSSIEIETQCLEFVRFGTLPYFLSSKKFGQEKGVDTKLTSDLIRLANIYDVAIIISGDADYIPPTKVIKDLGKRVYTVSFLSKNGRVLPGGAWRLTREVDDSYEIPFGEMLTLMKVTETKNPNP